MWLFVNSDGFTEFYVQFCSRKSKFVFHFETTLSMIIPCYHTVVRVGDFNINVVDMQFKVVTNFIALLDGLGLKQVIDALAKTTYTKSILIDLILVTNDASNAVAHSSRAGNI